MEQVGTWRVTLGLEQMHSFGGKFKCSLFCSGVLGERETENIDMFWAP